MVSLSCAADELSPFHMLHIHHALCQAGCIIVVRYVWPKEDPSTKRVLGWSRPASEQSFAWHLRGLYEWSCMTSIHVVTLRGYQMVHKHCPLPP